MQGSTAPVVALGGDSHRRRCRFLAPQPSSPLLLAFATTTAKGEPPLERIPPRRFRSPPYWQSLKGNVGATSLAPLDTPSTPIAGVSPLRLGSAPFSLLASGAKFAVDDGRFRPEPPFLLSY